MRVVVGRRTAPRRFKFTSLVYEGGGRRTLKNSIPKNQARIQRRRDKKEVGNAVTLKLFRTLLGEEEGRVIVGSEEKIRIFFISAKDSTN